MKRSIVMLMLIFMLGVPVASADETMAPPQQGREEKELEELLSIVQQETAVATKTKMNSDYVPGIVTVLEGDDLEAMGVVNAGEALGMVPGMFATIDRLGNRGVTVRGLDFPFNAGNILILLNGIALTRPDGGITGAALLIPAEQIERIEVIRGPGSVVYGDFAFMGLVNIVTRKEGTRVFGRLETPHRSADLGARVGSSGFSVNVSRTFSNDAATIRNVRNADDERTFAIASYDQGGLSLSAQSVQRDYDGHATGALFTENTRVLQGKYSKSVTPTLEMSAHATYLANEINDFTSQFDGHLLKFGVDAIWTGIAHHSFLLGADQTDSTIESASHRVPPPPGRPPGDAVRFVRDANREITGAYLQDRIDIQDRVSVTLGARVDKYSDLDSRVTPRAAVAWRINDRHILKAQYTEGFRPPTFFELYQPVAPNFIPRYYFETNATTEMNYVYRTTGQVARVTLFREVITNMIRPGGVITDPNAHAQGAELEWSRQIAAPIKVDANISYVETVDPRAIGPGAPSLPNLVSPRWLLNTDVFYRPVRGVIIGTRFNHIGDRSAGRNTDQLDVTVSKEDAFVPGLSLRAGVKNAFNSVVTYLFQNPAGGIVTNTFQGRSVWLQVSWKR